MEDFQTGRTSFRWPKRPAYWSLDPEGLEGLSVEEAERLGFPPFQLATTVVGKSWNASVYAGLRRFHQAKGYDPDSQEVAIHLGLPLVQLSRDADSPFAHVDDWIDERPDEEVMDRDQEHEESPFANHEEDEECSVCDSDSKESSTEGNNGRVDGHLEACAQPRKVQQEQMGHNSSSMDQGMHTTPQIANEHTTAGGFIRRFFRRLERGLVTETDNVDSDPISPFLI
ncbi:hypothetical protein B0H16DRAFT_1756734 [Mycena metata]|uniref:Uncharacterized protein n=1 Tax=Mycena metata TaxID=1033252 RepID=A0AAD7NTL7_9AGAR|nr:hypothetical protein B0H16DRAFT_1756734 [Mycena metata]